jgi:hypothetical protein
MAKRRTYATAKSDVGIASDEDVLDRLSMEVQDDTKLEGSIRVLLNAQDHTLGNMLRS